MKKILIILSLIISGLTVTNKANAGLYDWRYFEPATGCVIAGGLGYVTESNAKNKMKTAAIYCAATAVVVGITYSHYDTKYGAEFEKQKTFLDNKIKNYEQLERQNKSGVPKDPHFHIIQEELPAIKGPNGIGIGKRIKNTLILKDAILDRVGE